MDLFKGYIDDQPVRINIYADEIQSKKCPYTNDDWFYIGIIVENMAHELLPEIIDIRYCGNNNRNSVYFQKNDRLIHWVDVTDIDSKNICHRWLEFILDPIRSQKSFHAYILGINNSKLNSIEFGNEQEFNRKYNRFFRSAVLYSLKCNFPNKNIIIENIYHEQGQQQFHEYFPWHCIHRIDQSENKVTCECDSVTFLPKSHRDCERSNIVQLCDLYLGISTTAIHGLEKSNTSKYKAGLIDMFLPLLKRMINNPSNVRSSYAHSNRIMIRFFPKENTDIDDIRRYTNQFYTARKIHYLEELSGQMSLSLY